IHSTAYRLAMGSPSGSFRMTSSALGGFTWLVLFFLAGETLVRWTPLPLPGAVAGMLLLLSAFAILGGVPDGVRAAGDALLSHLLLLVPATAALTLHGSRVAAEWLPIALGAVGSAGLAMA